MSRSKKTRKVGESTSKFKPRTKKTERTLAKKKRDNGNKTGSRHNEGTLQQASPNAKKTQNADPRHGSKKPVALNIAATANTQATKVATVKAVKVPKLSDEQRLLQLENDPRLNLLLDHLEEGRDLSNKDQQWLDQQLAEIEKLMDKLGLTEEEDFAPVKSDSEEDLLARFESGQDLLKQYQ